MSNKKLSSLSVFFPCYNEEENLPVILNQALLVLPKVAKKYEIIVVNDGSSDDTKKVAQKFASQFPNIKVISHQTNKGYGAAIRTGINESANEWIFFTDGDGQFDLNELDFFVENKDKFMAILGYRRSRAEGLRRALFAKLYKLYIDLLFRVHVKDIDCAFKLIKAEELKQLSLFSSGAFISSEILYKLKKKHIKFKQLPVNHYSRKFGSSTGANLRVIVIGLWEPLKLYLRMKFGLKLKNTNGKS